jgi:hypothetical protein
MEKSTLEKLRTPRIKVGDINISVFDTVGTVAGAVVIAKVLNISVIPTIATSFVIGHAVHVALGIETGLNILSGNNNE